MHVLLVHNEYGKSSGEETVVRAIGDLLEGRGHAVTSYFRSSAELTGRRVGVAKAFFTGIYNPRSRRTIRKLLSEQRPDIVHIHNLFPIISPSILGECRRAGVPVVMTVHNYRLVCPNGLHMLHNRICEKCLGGREYHCVLNRCEGSLFKSAGYALRNAVARKMRFFHDNVTVYAALTDFQRRRLIDAGFPHDRIDVIPNMVDESLIDCEEGLGEWVGFVGRVSPEKGMPTLFEAAAKLPHVPFRIAGAYDRMPHLPAEAPPNVTFLGHVNGEKLAEFYRRSRIVLLTSTCFEGFPTVIVEAMLRGRPFICPRLGGMPEIVDDERTGLLFEPGSSSDLAQKIARIWDDPKWCRSLGQAGKAKALQSYTRERYHERLMALYARAQALGPGGAGATRGKRPSMAEPAIV